MLHAESPSLDDLLALARITEKTISRLDGQSAPRVEAPSASRPRLRIGYVGAEHESWRLKVIAQHDPDVVEVVVFHQSPLTVQLPAAGHIHPVAVTPDSPEALYEAVSAAALDVLIDCVAFADPTIPPLLMRRCAPCQIAWGYPGPTAGLHDFHFFDRIEATPSMQAHFQATLRLIPSARLGEIDCDGTADRKERRSDLALADGAFVMANAVRNANAILPMLSLWAKLIGALPSSLLWLPALDAQGRRTVIRAMQKAGIPEAKVLFSAMRSATDLAAADLYLDTDIFDPDFALQDALASGTLAVARFGTTPATRRSASLLVSTGLGELVAPSDEALLEIVTGLAGNSGRQTTLQKQLRDSQRDFERRCRQLAAAIEAGCREPGHHLSKDDRTRAEAWFVSAFEQFATRPHAESLALLDRAMAAGCDRPDAWNLYGALMRKSGNGDAAVFAFREAVRQRPDFSDAWMNLGNAYRDLLRIDEAVAAYRRALALKPDAAVCHLNLGSCLNAHGEPAEALAVIDSGLALDPDHADMHWDRALALLMLGHTREAWPEYEWRHRRQQPPKRNYPQPEWTGQSLQGQRLLIYWEQGYGDTLQFLRFIPRLARLGARIILHVQPGLGSLLESYPGVATVIDDEGTLPEFDYHVALLSLPQRLDISADDLLPAPELQPSAALCAAWAPRIENRGRPRIGVIWAGNPNVKNDHIRSPRLEPLIPLLEIPSIDWFILQKGDGRRDLEDWQLPDNVIDLAADITSFADTAAIMAGLDLVISSDTSTAHLALALGRPTWVLLHHGSDWRWGLGERSIWYPSARLFRQSQLQHWESVIDQVRNALATEFPSASVVRTAQATQVVRSPKVMSAAIALSADALFRQAISHFQSNDLESALRDTRLGLDADPQRADGWNMLGVINRRSGRFEDAREAYLEAIRLNAGFPDAWQNLGNLYRTWGRADEAEQAFLKAIEISPAQAPSWSQLSDLYRAAGKLDRAVECARHATKHAPDLAEGWNHLGNAFNDLEDFAAATPAYLQALRANPGLHEARYNLGVAYQRQQKLDEAVACYHEMLRARPDDARAHYNLGTSFMAMGRLRDGFVEYEWRFKRGDDLRRRTYPQPEWRGEPITGRRLLVYAEQGYGDTLQFLRFVPLLQQAGCKVILEVQTGLRALAQGLPGLESVVETGEHLPEFDLHAPLLSLPFLLGIGDTDLPATLPYLTVPADRLEHWGPRLPRNGRLRVGVIWAGNPKVGNDRVRSPRLPPLLPLFELDGIDWFVLQQGDGRRDLEGRKLPAHIHDVANEIAAFVDSAAVMQHLDLVISSDTSTAHLAPAVGTPTWVLLHHSADWRWGTGADTPWYPGSRLFRQPAAGDWATPVRMIAAALQAMQAERQTASAGS